MRFLVVLLAAVVFIGICGANMGPPPKGKKYAGITNTVKLEKELKGFTLFTRHNAIEWELSVPVPFDVDNDKPVKVPANPRGTTLYAVPSDLAPKLKTADDWKAALKDKDNGIVQTWFSTLTELDETDERKGIERAWVIKSIDPKGIVKEEVKDEKKPEKKGDKPLALAEPGTLIGGLAAAVAITLGGLWLVRRRKADR